MTVAQQIGRSFVRSFIRLSILSFVFGSVTHHYRQSNQLINHQPIRGNTLRQEVRSCIRLFVQSFVGSFVGFGLVHRLPTSQSTNVNQQAGQSTTQTITPFHFVLLRTLSQTVRSSVRPSVRSSVRLSVFFVPQACSPTNQTNHFLHQDQPAMASAINQSNTLHQAVVVKRPQSMVENQITESITTTVKIDYSALASRQAET